MINICYIKHVLDPLYVFFTLSGCMDGGKRLGHNLIMQFSTLGSSNMEISKTDFFFDILTIHNDEISYVKHVLDPLFMVFVTGSSFRRAALLRRGAPTGGWALEQRIGPPIQPLDLCA